ncbi:MAG: hypothetical protein Ct9H90mP4_14140 [Gammaproteobacteria bacterium]|nr:MAG: hypothetical protein Ct9H90mP4_14140 [Gammaproteobacteria bacterium]
MINEIHQKLEEGEDFKILARQYSEDPGSKKNGGELGWAPMGTFTSQFEKVMIESKLNEDQNHLNLNLVGIFLRC